MTPLPPQDIFWMRDQWWSQSQGSKEPGQVKSMTQCAWVSDTISRDSTPLKTLKFELFRVLVTLLKPTKISSAIHIRRVLRAFIVNPVTAENIKRILCYFSGFCILYTLGSFKDIISVTSRLKVLIKFLINYKMYTWMLSTKYVDDVYRHSVKYFYSLTLSSALHNLVIKKKASLW